ncbi:MAG: hypothetical protein OXK76_10455 [Gammaproteobacteria bacterium]|nr:hypothetical protein [Gammaproteobacteria bacterium]
MGYESLKQEPTKRLSLNLPESLHTRFKTACSATNRKMGNEIQRFVERRTEEIEREAGLDASPWAEQVARRNRPWERAARRSKAVARALACNHPTGDIGEMLGDIERGRDIR